MKKVKQALQLLEAFGLPEEQKNDRSALTLLALGHIGPKDAWSNLQQPLLRIWDIMDFMRERYKKDYAANSRETIRRYTIHQFEQACLVCRNIDDPKRPTNSGKTVYCLSDDAAAVIRLFGTDEFGKAIVEFKKKHGSLLEAYNRSRTQHQVPLILPDGSKYFLSPGKHNELQALIITEFGPRFAPGSSVLYVGDTELKHVVCRSDELAKLHVPITEHDKLPDIILYREDKNWLYLIEAVSTHGPVSPKRYSEIETILSNCTAIRIYVTAFVDNETFRKYIGKIAWDTEVWIAANPDHMIHFNGEKFLGPCC